MKTEQKTPAMSEEDLYFWNEVNVLKGMTPEQQTLAEKRHELSGKALAHHKAGQSVKTEEDFAKKIQSMDDVTFSRFKQDLNWAAQKKGGV